MDSNVKSFSDFMLKTLTAEQYLNLSTLLGISDYRLTWLLKNDKNRLSKVRPSELIRIATLLNVKPEFLIIEYGVGIDMTVRELVHVVKGKLAFDISEKEMNHKEVPVA